MTSFSGNIQIRNLNAQPTNDGVGGPQTIKSATDQNLNDTIEHRRKLSGRFKKAAIATGVAAAALAVGAVVVKFVPVIAALVASFAPLPAVVIGLGVAAAILGGIAIACAVYFLYNKKKDNDGQSNNTPTQTTNINQKEETNSQNEQLENDNDKPQNGEQIDTNPNSQNEQLENDEDKNELQNEPLISPTDNTTVVPEIRAFLREFKEKNLGLFGEMCESLVEKNKQSFLGNEWGGRIDETIDKTIENIKEIPAEDENLSTAAQEIAKHIIEECHKLDGELRKCEQEVEKADKELDATCQKYNAAYKKLEEADQKWKETCQRYNKAEEELQTKEKELDAADKNREETHQRYIEAENGFYAKKEQADEARLPIIAYRGIIGIICEYAENEHAIDNEFYDALKEYTEQFVSLSNDPENPEVQQRVLKVIIEKILERKLKFQSAEQTPKNIQNVVGEFLREIKGKLIYKMREIFRNLKMPVSPL